MSAQVHAPKRCEKPSNPAHNAIMKLCWFSQKGDVVPKAPRKYSLGRVTNEGAQQEDTSVYFEKVCREIKQLESEYEHRNDSPSKRMKRGLLHIKRQRDHLSERLIKKMQNADRTAFKQLLKNMNKLKNVRDFDNFCKAHEIGTLDERESISDCEENLSRISQLDHSLDISNPGDCIIAPESWFSSWQNPSSRKDAWKRNKKKMEINNLFRVVEKKRDRVRSSITNGRDIQENPTGTSPIPTADTPINKFFDFTNAKIDLKRSQNLQVRYLVSLVVFARYFQ